MTLTRAVQLWGAVVSFALSLLGLLFWLHEGTTVALVLWASASLFFLLIWLFGLTLKPWG